jgi:hypothetical protein
LSRVTPESRDVRWFLRRFHTPLLLVGVCVLGAVLQFGLGLPGTPVWLGVIVAEIVIWLGDRFERRTQRASRRPENARADPVETWTAQIDPYESDAGGGFRVVASNSAGDSVVIAESAVADWPAGADERSSGADERSSGADERSAGEDDRAAVRARIVDGLTRALLDAGWVDRGDESTQPRFAWTGAPAGGLPPAWPDEIAHCELRWASGYRSSRFEAVAHLPSDRRGRVIATSEPFPWMLREPPDQQNGAQAGAVEMLRHRLSGSGWEEVEPGPAWYALRFVWRREGEPPEATG